MKKIIFVFTLLSYLVGFGQDCEWNTTKDEKRGYRINFPLKPTAQSQEVPTAVGNVTMDMYMLDLSTDSSSKNVIYMTAYTEYPKDSDYSDEGLQNSMLDGAVSGAVENVNGDLISSDKIRFNGYNGRNAKIKIYNGTYIINLKNILVENKLYFLQVITVPKDDDNAEMNRFFESFDLIKTQ